MGQTREVSGYRHSASLVAEARRILGSGSKWSAMRRIRKETGRRREGGVQETGNKEGLYWEK